MTGCVKRRSTLTTTVLSCLSLTTTPCNTRFGIVFSLSPGAGALRALQRADAGDVATDLAHAAGVLELSRGPLEAQVELLLLEVQELVGKLVRAHRLDVGEALGRFHVSPPPYSAMRWMKRVLIGSFAAPRRSASRAMSSGTPSISNMIRPGFTRAAQNSGAPLPLPMRTSVGFDDTGTSGKMRIHTRPARFMARVIARRAASICRALTRSGSSALRPNWPKFRSTPPFAVPETRPLNCLRNFVFFGCSMANLSWPLRAYAACSRRPPERPPSSFMRLSCAIGSCSRISPLKIQTLMPQVPYVVNAVAVP